MGRVDGKGRFRLVPSVGLSPSTYLLHDNAVNVYVLANVTGIAEDRLGLVELPHSYAQPLSINYSLRAFWKITSLKSCNLHMQSDTTIS